MEHIQLKNGTRTAYKTAGNGPETLLFLHGFCGSSAYWDKLAPLLPQFRLILPDLRGHGGSTGKEEPHTMEMFAEDLALFAEALELPPFHLFGHSLGGYVTLAFAEKYPGKLASFGLIHSTPFPDDEAARANRDKSAESIRQNGMEPFIRGLVPRLFAPGSLSARQDDAELAKKIGLATDPKAAILTLKGMRDRSNRLHVLEESKVPVLLVAGDADQIVPASKTFAADGPHVQQVLLEGVGHMGMLEAPEKMAEAIARFVRKEFS